MLINRRPEYRKDAFKFGAVRREGTSDLPCLVWDLSSRGAKLEVEEPDAVPERFTLTLGADGQPAPCRVIWRSGMKVGVAFLRDASAHQA